jgi:hypothetical protein
MGRYLDIAHAVAQREKGELSEEKLRNNAGSANNPDRLATMLALSVPTHGRFEKFKSNGTGVEQPKSHTDSADNPDTVAPAADIALAGLATSAKGLDPDTGDAIPRKLAMLEPTQSEVFAAKLISFCPKRSPEAIPLVDIRCPANSGGMKGLVFKVSQVPGLIRALQQVQAAAVERGLIEKPVSQ